MTHCTSTSGIARGWPNPAGPTGVNFYLFICSPSGFPSASLTCDATSTARSGSCCVAVATPANFGSTIVPPEDVENEEEFAMADKEVTQREDWRDPERPPSSAIPLMSVRLAAEEQRERQEEIRRQFRPSCNSAILRQAMESPCGPPRPV
jgi:hypothetical protein